MPQAEIDGSIITLRNIRNFSYRTEQDFVPQWEERTVDLENLDSLDLIAVYWMGDAIAHIILSFGFGEQHIAISIEIRKEEGEAYSTLAGLFRQYELYYVVGDERDLIGVRTTYREPPEDVYLYRIDIPKENIRRLFLEYLRKINGLHDAPEFYNTMTTNCTTNIATHVWALGGKLPLKWEILVSGYFPNLIYDRGGLDQTRPFAELRELSLINTKARSADGDEAFSTLIREGLPGMPDQ